MTVVVGTATGEVIGGATASNVLTGNAGNDLFVYFRNQTDTVITDFGSSYFTATINGAQEVPANSSVAVGSMIGVLNRAGTKFDFTAQVNGLDLFSQTPQTADNVTAAHFHQAIAGISGGVVWGFLGGPNNDLDAETTVNPTTGTITGQWDLNEGNAGATLGSMIPFLNAGQIYINFHTSVFPGGEVRGQVNPIDGGGDKIDLRDAHIGDFATLQTMMRDIGGSTVITTTFNGTPSSLILQGVPTSKLTANDFVFSDTTAGSVVGSAGVDDLFGAGGSDNIAGGGGNDRIWAALGTDTADGGDGNDSVLGGDGNDIISGGAGDDSLGGNTGGDVVVGGDGNDSVYGGKDNDTVFGEAGADRVSGDAGNDILYGGAGADRFLVIKGSGQDWIGDWNPTEGDRIQVAAGTAYTVTTFNNQIVLDFGGGDTIGLAGVAPAAFSADWIVFA